MATSPGFPFADRYAWRRLLTYYAGLGQDRLTYLNETQNLARCSLIGGARLRTPMFCPATQAANPVECE